MEVSNWKGQATAAHEKLGEAQRVIETRQCAISDILKLSH